MIDDNHDPDFRTRFTVTYDPLRLPRQQLKFIVYDRDMDNLRLEVSEVTE